MYKSQLSTEFQDGNIETNLGKYQWQEKLSMQAWLVLHSFITWFKNGAFFVISNTTPKWL
jgi:hypothetical protein